METKGALHLYVGGERFVCGDGQGPNYTEHRARFDASPDKCPGCVARLEEPRGSSETPRCSFRFADAEGVFRQCEDAPALGAERCEEHEREMARLRAAYRAREQRPLPLPASALAGSDCDLCGSTLLAGSHGPGVCSAGEPPKWFSGWGERTGRAPGPFPDDDLLSRAARSPAAREFARFLAGQPWREPLRAAVSALRALGDPYGLDADRLEQAESPRTLVSRAEAALEEVVDAYHRGSGERAALGTAHDALRKLRDVLRPPGRARATDPEAVPWRERANTDPLAHALVYSHATDAEAADLFASACARGRKERHRLVELTAPPSRFVVPAPVGAGNKTAELMSWLGEMRSDFAGEPNPAPSDARPEKDERLERVRRAARVVAGASKLDVLSREGEAELRAVALATLSPEERAEAEEEARRAWLSPEERKPEPGPVRDEERNPNDLPPPDEIDSAEGEHLRSVAKLLGVPVLYPPEPDDALREKVREAYAARRRLFLAL